VASLALVGQFGVRPYATQIFASLRVQWAGVEEHPALCQCDPGNDQDSDECGNDAAASETTKTIVHFYLLQQSCVV